MIRTLMRIGGLVDSAGNEIIFSTADGPAGRTVITAISAPVRISGSRLSPGAALASSGGCSVAMTYTPALAPLLRRDLDWPGGAGQPPRIERTILPGDTQIRLDQLNLPNGLIWCAGEVMRITDEPIPGRYDVDRAVGSLGAARAPTAGGFADEVRPIVLSRQPTPDGARVLISTWNGSVETFQFRGYVRGVTARGSTVTVDVGSSLDGLRQRPAERRPVDRTVERLTRYVVSVQDLTAQTVIIFTSFLPAEYVRVWVGDAWYVQQGTSAGGLTRLEPEILQWGRGSVPYPIDSPPRELVTEDGSVEVSFFEVLPSFPAGPPATIAASMMQAQFPEGAAGGLAASDIGDLSALNDAWGGGNLTVPFGVSTGDWWPLPQTGRTMAEWVAGAIFAPLSCAMTTDALGRITAVDWTRAIGTNETITPPDLYAPAVDLSESQPLRAITWKYQAGEGTTTIALQSDYARQVSQGGESIEVSPGWALDVAPLIVDRLRAMLTVWQYPAPITTLSLGAGEATAVNPGDLFRLTVGTIIGRNGLRGITGVDAVVLETARTLAEPTRSVTVALTGYTAAVNYGLWSPSGVIAAVAGSVLTITMDNLELAADWFTAGLGVQILDPDGAILEAGIVVASATGNDVTVTGMTITPTLGDRLVYEAAGARPLIAYFGEGFTYV